MFHHIRRALWTDYIIGAHNLLWILFFVAFLNIIRIWPCFLSKSFLIGFVQCFISSIWCNLYFFIFSIGCFFSPLLVLVHVFIVIPLNYQSQCPFNLVCAIVFFSILKVIFNVLRCNSGAFTTDRNRLAIRNVIFNLFFSSRERQTLQKICYFRCFICVNGLICSSFLCEITHTPN